MVHDHPLNCQNLVVWEGRWLPFWRSEASPCFLGSPLVADKQNPNHCGKDAVSTNPVVSSFLARAFVPNLCDLIWSFSSWPLLLHQLVPNPVTWKTGHLESTSKLRATLPCHQEAERTLERQEHQAVPAPTCHLGLWPGKLLPSHPNTRHCLGIHVTLTEETGAAPPPPHAWIVPLVEDMLCHGRTSLAKAVVMGPGRAVLFYGRWSLGEGLSLGEGQRHCIYTYRSRHLGW